MTRNDCRKILFTGERERPAPLHHAITLQNSSTVFECLFDSWKMKRGTRCMSSLFGWRREQPMLQAIKDTGSGVGRGQVITLNNKKKKKTNKRRWRRIEEKDRSVKNRTLSFIFLYSYRQWCQVGNIIMLSLLFWISYFLLLDSLGMYLYIPFDKVLIARVWHGYVTRFPHFEEFLFLFTQKKHSIEICLAWLWLFFV